MQLVLLVLGLIIVTGYESMQDDTPKSVSAMIVLTHLEQVIHFPRLSSMVAHEREGALRIQRKEPS